MSWQLRKLRRGNRTLGFYETLAAGLLLACAITLVETVEQPLGTIVSMGLLTDVLRGNVVFGLCWSFLARTLEPRLDLFRLVAASIGAGFIFTILAVLFDKAMPANMPANALGAEALACHYLWINAFYGSLYMAAFVGMRRAMRSRDTLERVRIARDHSEALLEEVQLNSIRRQLQPKSMLDALDTLRLFYRNDPAKADDLLDQLVAFLRIAVRSLNSDTTTLATELDLARRFLRLRHSTGGQVGELNFDNVRAAPEIAFPAGIIMPMIEHLCAASKRVSLRAAWVGETYCVTFGAHRVSSKALPDRLRKRAESIYSQPGTRIHSEMTGDRDSFHWMIRVNRTSESICEPRLPTGVFP